MTPLSSVAMLEKLALFRIAFCSAPVLSSAASRRTSAMTFPVVASSSRTPDSRAVADMGYLCGLHNSGWPAGFEASFEVRSLPEEAGRALALREWVQPA